ncbi:MAG TPA: AraC family transcriptional regulator [Herpetosiphon sp.]|uniref:Transcriptional regulator, AraC family n=1 Tax=Herpetosiphon aurantiacus (strain ATCC 23779 / DSM 785 / 114-95) TaxID=316274 RepID=A9AYD8_HERA2|nr:helix-turn-helix transcriptional regulator [Herpetosiphon sp.]ABX03520.1 transcriptional regulator, AraC family [Herpetosiphon aurantiacus DSM 785]HBW51754.1 AraC family transcriptional regulator [Herpetosiphon sp.]
MSLESGLINEVKGKLADQRGTLSSIRQPSRPDQWHDHDQTTHYSAAVERVIGVMRGQSHELLRLEQLADIANLSPFHFNRIFRQTVGLPPGKFLSTLRLDRAKRLLLTTDLSITTICFEAGYSSLGTFTTQFTQVVGVSPRRLRLLRATFETPRLDRLHHQYVHETKPDQQALTVHGSIIAPESFSGSIFIGLYPIAAPLGQPVSCVFLNALGDFQLKAEKPGRYHLFAGAIPWSNDPLAYLLPCEQTAWFARTASVIMLRSDTFTSCGVMSLRRRRPTDPPLLTIPSALTT